MYKGEDMKIAKTVPDALKILWHDKFFMKEKSQKDVEDELHKRGYNFGDTTPSNRQLDMLPSLAAKVKHKLQIKNPNTIAYDVPFGCPGWVQAVIQANYYIKSGDAKKILVIGAEVLSRVYDPAVGC